MENNNNKAIIGISLMLIGLVFVFISMTAEAASIGSLTSNQFFAHLISSTGDLGSGEAIFEIRNPLDTDLRAEDIGIDVIGGKTSTDSIQFYIEKTETIIKTRNITIPACSDSIDKNGSSIRTCEYSESSIKYSENETSFYPVMAGEIIVRANSSAKMKVVAHWKPDFGGHGREWIPYVRARIGGDMRILYHPAWAWWDTNWQYRKCGTVGGVTASLTDFPIGFNVTFDSNMTNSMIDLRFTNGTSEIVLDYWTEQASYGNWAYVWVKGNWTNSGANQICMYYGNPAAVNVSNGNSTFPFFDDFEGTAIKPALWTVRGGFPSVSGGEVTLQNATADEGISGTAFKFGVNYAVRFRMKTINANAHSASSGFSNHTTASCADVATEATVYKYSNVGYADSRNISGQSNQVFISASWNDQVYHVFEIERNSTVNLLYYFDSINVANRTSYMTIASDHSTCLSSRAGDLTNTYNVVDWALVRPISLPDQTVSFGAEESVPVTIVITLNSPVTGASTSNTKPDFNFTVTDGNGTYNCSLNLDGLQAANNPSVSNNTATVINPDLDMAIGLHSWNVTCAAYSNSNSSENRTINITAAAGVINYIFGEDPLMCDIPSFVPNTAQYALITCRPIDNSTGLPMTGQTINCQANDINMNLKQAVSSMTEMTGRIYIWQLTMANVDQGNCDWINCTTTINGLLDGWGGLVCRESNPPSDYLSILEQQQLANASLAIAGNISINMTPITNYINSTMTTAETNTTANVFLAIFAILSLIIGILALKFDRTMLWLISGLMFFGLGIMLLSNMILGICIIAIGLYMWIRIFRG